MHHGGKKYIVQIEIALFSILLFVGIIFCGSQKVQASGFEYYYDSQALPLAPSGIPIGNLGDNDLFKAGAGTNGIKPAIYSGNDSMILLSNGKNANTVTSVWGNKEQDNYIDITQRQTLTAWLYFGDNYGVGLEGMALVLQNSGYDAIARTKANGAGDIAGGESLGVWGSDIATKKSNGYYDTDTLKATSDDMAKTALPNSFALEFDTNKNGNDSSDPVTGERQNAFDSYQVDYSPPRSLPDQHAAYGYPGQAYTYKSLGTDTFTTGSFFQSKNFPYYIMRHKGIEEQVFAGNNHPSEAWHHITITYDPGTDATGPTLTYALNDKLIDGRAVGSGSTGQKLYRNVVDLDMSAFGDLKDNKLYYGFTGANMATNPKTAAIVFESMPSLVQAEANGYVVDKTTDSKMSYNTDIMDDESLKLNDTEKAHPGDDLRLNYMLKYESGKQPAKDLNETIDVPDGVTVSSDASIGTVYYKGTDNATGNPTTKSVDIPASSYDSSTKKVSIPIEDMGKTGSDETYWKTARIELKTTADDLPDGKTSLTVPVGHVAIKGSNYVTDTETPQFDIVNPADKLILTKTSGDGTYSATDLKNGIDLKGTAKYEKKDTIDPANVKFIYQEDNGDELHGADTTGNTGESMDFSIPIINLTDGKHTIKVKAVSNIDGDVISSNTLEYNVEVSSRKLVIKPDNQKRTVNDDGIQTITGTLSISDGSRIGVNTAAAYGYLTDGNGNHQSKVGLGESPSNKYVYNEDHTEVKYTFSVRPIGYTGLGIVSQSNKNGLTVGTNKYTLSFESNALGPDGSQLDRTIGTVTYEFDVPDLDLELSNSGQEKITTLRGNQIHLPSTIKYSDPDHSYSPRHMSSIGTVDNISAGTCIANDYYDDSYITGEYNVQSGMNTPTVGEGFDNNKESFKAEYYVIDPYLRKSNSVYYDVNVIQNYAKLTTGKNYSFGQHVVDPQIDRYLKRSGDWQLSVESMNSPWKLSASATDFVRNNEAGGNADVLDGGMVYVDPSNKDNVHALNVGANGTPVEIKEQDTKDSKTTNIGGNWSDDDGILLDLNSASVKGSYSSTITWNLTDSI